MKTNSQVIHMDWRPNLKAPTENIHYSPIHKAFKWNWTYATEAAPSLVTVFRQGISDHLIQLQT